MTFTKIEPTSTKLSFAFSGCKCVGTCCSKFNLCKGCGRENDKVLKAWLN